MEVLLVLALLYYGWNALFGSSSASTPPKRSWREEPAPRQSSTTSYSGNNNGYSSKGTGTQGVSGEASKYFIEYPYVSYSKQGWELEGKSVIVNHTRDTGYFISFLAGMHRMSDSHFVITYDVIIHYTENQEKKVYFKNIFLNGRPVEGLITNSQSALTVLRELVRLSEWDIFGDEHRSGIGYRFVIECACLVAFNNYMKRTNHNSLYTMSALERNRLVEMTYTSQKECYDQLMTALYEGDTVDAEDGEKYDYFLPYSKAVYDNGWVLDGDSFIIKHTADSAELFFLVDGQHTMADRECTISYEVASHFTKSNNRKIYLKNIEVNGASISRMITNSQTAIEAILQMHHLSRERLFGIDNENGIGYRFVIECANLLANNAQNDSITYEGLFAMRPGERDALITAAAPVISEFLSELITKLDEELWKAEEPTSDSKVFEVYLRVLGFKSVNGVTYEDIKSQYKQMAKRYHPDASTGDADHFILIQESYEYLMKNYPV